MRLVNSTLMLFVILFFIPQVLAFSVTNDTLSYQGEPNAGHDNIGLYIQAAPDGFREITYLYFDISSIPANSTINSATLTLTNSMNTASIITYVTPVSSVWTELSLTWTNQPSTILPHSSNVVVIGAGSYSWDITDFVRHWNNGSYQNYGLAVEAGNGSGIQKRFDDHEGTIGIGSPVVEIDYTPAEGTNSIKLSNTTNYNLTTSVTNNISSPIYITTFVNNSLWSIWSPLNTQIVIYRPNYEYPHEYFVVWSQNAFQKEYYLDAGLFNSPVGIWTFKLIRGYLFEDILSTATLNVTDLAIRDNYLKLNKDKNNVSYTYKIDASEYTIVDTYLRIYYINRYNSASVLLTNYPTLFSVENVPITSYISSLNYFSGSGMTLKAELRKISDNSLIASDEIYYQYDPFLDVIMPTLNNTTPSITPYIKPNITYSPYPTYTPYTYSDNNTSNSFNGSPLGQISTIYDMGNDSLGNINIISNDTNTEIKSYNYNKSKGVLAIFLPAIFGSIPYEIWLIIILGWAFEKSLIIIKR